MTRRPPVVATICPWTAHHKRHPQFLFPQPVGVRGKAVLIEYAAMIASHDDERGIPAAVGDQGGAYLRNLVVDVGERVAILVAHHFHRIEGKAAEHDRE